MPVIDDRELGQKASGVHHAQSTILWFTVAAVSKHNSAVGNDIKLSLAEYIEKRRKYMRDELNLGSAGAKIATEYMQEFVNMIDAVMEKDDGETT